MRWLKLTKLTASSGVSQDSRFLLQPVPPSTCSSFSLFLLQPVPPSACSSFSLFLLQPSKQPLAPPLETRQVITCSLAAVPYKVFLLGYMVPDLTLIALNNIIVDWTVSRHLKQWCTDFEKALIHLGYLWIFIVNTFVVINLWVVQFMALQ